MDITTIPEVYVACKLCEDKHRLAPASCDPSGRWEAPIYASCEGFLKELEAGDEVEVAD